jgi:preprotein translocase subunit YajC
MGSIATAAAATSSGGSSTFLILIVVVFIGFYFLLIRPQRNRQRKVQEQQNTVQTGARVRTTSGMYATVVAVDGDDVVLEIAPGIEARFLKRAIMEVVGEGPGAPAEDFVDETEEPGDVDAEPEHDVAEPATDEATPGPARRASRNGTAGTTEETEAAKSGEHGA